SPCRRETMPMVERYSGASGNGTAVCSRIVNGSMTSVPSIGFTYSAKLVTVVGTTGTRAMVNATSSAVRTLPSEKRTSGRRRNSQVVSSIMRQDAARFATRWSCASVVVSASNTFGMKLLLPPKLCTCGSMESGSTVRPSRNSAAVAGVRAVMTRTVRTCQSRRTLHLVVARTVRRGRGRRQIRKGAGMLPDTDARIEAWLSHCDNPAHDPLQGMVESGLLEPADTYSDIARIKAALVARTGLPGVAGVWGGRQL